MTTNREVLLGLIVEHGSKALLEELDERIVIHDEDDAADDQLDRVDAFDDLYNVMCDNKERGAQRTEVQGLLALSGAYTVLDPKRYLIGGNRYDFIHRGVKYVFDHAGGFSGWLEQETVK